MSKQKKEEVIIVTILRPLDKKKTTVPFENSKPARGQYRVTTRCYARTKMGIQDLLTLQIYLLLFHIKYYS